MNDSRSPNPQKSIIPKVCPKCGSTWIARYSYGYRTEPPPPIKRGDPDPFVCAGCSVDVYNSPKWTCLDCGEDLYNRNIQYRPWGNYDPLDIPPGRFRLFGRDEETKE